MSVIFRINNNGSVTALSGSGIEEVLDLRIFGRVKAVKAGNIYFNEDTQTWYWTRPNGQKGGEGFRTRKEAVAHEIETLTDEL